MITVCVLKYAGGRHTITHAVITPYRATMSVASRGGDLEHQATVEDSLHNATRAITIVLCFPVASAVGYPSPTEVRA